MRERKGEKMEANLLPRKRAKGRRKRSKILWIELEVSLMLILRTFFPRDLIGMSHAE
jgi:hypothetical protein